MDDGILPVLFNNFITKDKVVLHAQRIYAQPDLTLLIT